MKNCIIIFTISAALGLSGLRAELRTWTSTSGTKIEAELVKADGNEVTLKSGDGRIINAKLSQLSVEDQNFVKSKEEIHEGPNMEAKASNKTTEEYVEKESHRIRFDPPGSMTVIQGAARSAANYFNIKITQKQEKALKDTSNDGVMRTSAEIAAIVGIKYQRFWKNELTPDIHTFVQKNLNDKLVIVQMKKNGEIKNAFVIAYSNVIKSYELYNADRKGDEKLKMKFEDFEEQVNNATLLSPL